MRNKLIVAIASLSVLTACDDGGKTAAEYHEQESKFIAQEVYCLAENIYHEARGESIMEQAAVAWVTLNRVESRDYPDTICEVVMQPYQFSWTLNPELIAARRNPEAYEKAIRIANDVYSGRIQDPTWGATHYHTHEVSPKWSNSGYDVVRLDAHKYMKL